MDDNQTVNPPLDPAEYGPGSIRPLRMPEIKEAPEGGWWSRWHLRLIPPVDKEVLFTLANELRDPEGAVSIVLVPLTSNTVRLDLFSPVHPLEIEAYPILDRILRTIDGRTNGIAEINDSPRNWWRTFRTSSSEGPSGI